MISTITVNGGSVSLVALPPSGGLRSIDLTAEDAVAIVSSPFTGQTQAQAWPGADMWSWAVTAPPLTQAQADRWVSALLECRGMLNAFQLGDPLKAAARGLIGQSLVPNGNFAAGLSGWLPLGDAKYISDVGEAHVNMPGGSGIVSPTFPVVPGVTYYLNYRVYSGPGSGTFDLRVFRSPVYASNLSTTDYTDLMGSGTITSVPATYSYAWTCPAGINFASMAVYPLTSGVDANCVSVSITIAGIPVINVAGGTMVPGGEMFYMRGWAPLLNGVLLPGDHVQVGYRLHQVLDVVNSDASGLAAVTVWPSLREAPADGLAVITESPQGIFRLATNKRTWSKDMTRLTRLSFQAMEYR